MASRGDSNEKEHRDVHPVQLNVEEDAKVTAVSKMRRVERRRTSRFQVATKWVFTAIVFALLLGCVTLNKISIVFLSENLRSNDESEVEKSARTFVMILFILLAPNVFNFLRGCYTVVGTELSWPDWKTLLLTIGLGIIESAGLTCFAYKLLYLKHGGHVIAVMNCVFLPDILLNFLVCLVLKRGGKSKTDIEEDKSKKKEKPINTASDITPAQKTDNEEDKSKKKDTTINTASDITPAQNVSPIKDSSTKDEDNISMNEDITDDTARLTNNKPGSTKYRFICCSPPSSETESIPLQTSSPIKKNGTNDKDNYSKNGDCKASSAKDKAKLNKYSCASPSAGTGSASDQTKSTTLDDMTTSMPDEARSTKLISEENFKLIVYGIATVAGIAGFVLTLILYDELEGTHTNGWHFFLSIVLLSFVWSPYTQRYLIYRYQMYSSSTSSSPRSENSGTNSGEINGEHETTPRKYLEKDSSSPRSENSGTNSGEINGEHETTPRKYLEKDSSSPRSENSGTNSGEINGEHETTPRKFLEKDSSSPRSENSGTNSGEINGEHETTPRKFLEKDSSSPRSENNGTNSGEINGEHETTPRKFLEKDSSSPRSENNGTNSGEINGEHETTPRKFLEKDSSSPRSENNGTNSGEINGEHETTPRKFLEKDSSSSCPGNSGTNSGEIIGEHETTPRKIPEKDSSSSCPGNKIYSGLKTTLRKFLKNAPLKQDPAWTIVIVMSFFKVFFIAGFAFIFFVFDRHNTDFYALTYNHTMDIVKDFSNGLNWEHATHREIYYFVGNILGGFAGYFVGFFACTARMQAWGFAIPLIASSPLATILISIPRVCHTVMSETTEICVNSSLIKIGLSVGLLVLAHSLSIGLVIYLSKTIVMETEMQTFWIPTYNGVMLEQWLLLTKRNAFTDEHTSWHKKSLNSKVYICTTMYREEEHEVRQVLESIEAVNHAWVSSKKQERQHIESHIFFDGGVSASELNKFSLKLVSLVTETLGVNINQGQCKKTKTPYGMSLCWRLRGKEEEYDGMKFTIHLKDNVKVKNKKRWSQIMYMSYVLDFLAKKDTGGNKGEAFILTTDADVQFTRPSVEALMDRVTRDPLVGAVCGRTHPIGHGPLAWYQVFEYAVGHWLQKASEHMVGSVLCAPGCFSIYRCEALKDVLPIYASDVESAFDYLIKDMGEDRWLCTLMIEAGWRIEYCAASKCHTHCPTDFDEFFKQRRRWIGSSIANVMLFIAKWATIRKLNRQIPVIFLLYQLASLVASFIGPSTVIIVVAGGMSFAWKFDATAIIAVQLLICLVFGFACLKASQETQLLMAKCLTFVYAIAIAAVLAATTKQIVIEVRNANSTNHVDNPVISPAYLPISTTTLYLAIICGIFIVTGFLHITELMNLLHGIWYIFGLPAGFLVLVIYSISNITDRSWGTREAKSVENLHNGNWKSFVKRMQSLISTVFFCCKEAEEQEDEERPTELTNFGQSTREPLPGTSSNHEQSVAKESLPSQTTAKKIALKREEMAMEIEDWLEDPTFKELYLFKFQAHGFDNTMFLRRITTDDLKHLIGITKKGHLHGIRNQIKQLPEFELLPSKPSRGEEFGRWLETIGLSRYIENFQQAKLDEAEALKKNVSTQKDIADMLQITKEGHVKQLLYAIRQLRKPTKGEEKLVIIKHSIDELQPAEVALDDREDAFWKRLIAQSLEPVSKAMGQEGQLKELLVGLRNRWLVMFTVANCLWLIISLTIASQAELMVLGTNVAGSVSAFT